MLEYMKVNFDDTIPDYDDGEYKDPTFIDYLVEAGFDYLVSEKGFSGRFFDANGCGEEDLHSHTAETWDDDIDDPELSEARYPDNAYSDDEYSGYKQGNIVEQLMQTFQSNDMTAEEFMRAKPWEFLDLTAHQFHHIDASQLSKSTFGDFVLTMLDPIVNDALPAYDKRIAYCTLMASAPKYFFLTYQDEIRYITDRIIGKNMNESLMRLQTYRDYQIMRVEAEAYNRYLLRLPEEDRPHPVFEYPIFPKPSALNDLHDKARRDQMAYNEFMIRDEPDEEEFSNEDFNEHIKAPEYIKYLYQNDRYAVIPVKDRGDLIREADALDNCLRTYAYAIAAGTSFIYFIRSKKEMERPLYAVEVCPSDGVAKLAQAYTYHNSIAKTAELRDFIIEWCNKKNIAIRCAL